MASQFIKPMDLCLLLHPKKERKPLHQKPYAGPLMNFPDNNNQEKKSGVQLVYISLHN
jgi:hypothetical protein